MACQRQADALSLMMHQPHLHQPWRLDRCNPFIHSLAFVRGRCIGLKKSSEPEIYNAIRFGSVLENVVFDEFTREVDFDSKCAPPQTPNPKP